ncbi:hypothetical protein DXH95_05645 [Sphingorhabdus pulchriflava]|uniref:Uncharacterized protein n=1 Tax=Sphingorhabdus pulchriflava TaxID=2292257 RepID=A0A371BH05_9SPHN|nr:hypothetical protein [Sphingorhabdus pulchriflava]RDV06879.1 hypothetical protein DXH95_05645 [Sphingorhabdus pulchriflava]
MVIVAICGAVLFGLLGLGLWRQGEQWKQRGEIPKDWVEAKEPKPVLRDELGFGAAIAWKKAMGVVAWLFAGLCVLSAILQLMGMQL